MRTSHNNNQARGHKITATCFAVLLLSSLLTLSSCGSTAPINAGSTPTPTSIVLPTPTPSPSQPVTLKDIHMVDPLNGWAMTHDGQHLLHTTTGAAHWQEVALDANAQQYTLSSSTFPDAQNAWIGTQSNNKYAIYHTFDGGGLWTATPITNSTGSLTEITFFDTQNGWLLFNQEPAAGNEGITILHTTDDGMNWYATATTDNNPQGQIPFAGDKNGLTFLDASTGWLTGTGSVDNSVWLYVTHDSGSTWKKQALSLPADKVQITTLPPTFFNAKDGIMPTSIFTANGTGNSTSALEIYSTHDGGQSWQGSSPVTGLDTGVSFVDSSHGWTAGRGSSSISTTNDGGLHWTNLVEQIAPNVTGITKLNFISTSTGWALASTGTDTTALFQTTDGGKTWTLINTTASA